MDLSSKFFSLGGAVPSFLPSRLRLPNGVTRYSHSITQEEVEACGYTGPYDYPSLSSTQAAEWDSSALAWTVRDKTAEELKKLDIDLSVRNTIQNNIDIIEAEKHNFSGYLDSYVAAQFTLLDNCRELLKRTSYLVPSDYYSILPSAVQELDPDSGYPLYKTAAERQTAYDEWFAADETGLQTEYETYGVITHVPREFRDIFKVKSSWTCGSTPLPSDYQTVQFDYREGS